MSTLYHSDTLPTTPGIYRITCTANGKIYIGSSINLKDRWKRHRKDLRRNGHANKPLQHAWNKYGEQSFIFEVLELVLIPEMLTAREQHWFDKCKPFGRKGFNIAVTAGSSLGLKHSPEAIEKMRVASSNQPPRSPETIEKMRIRMLGNTHLLGHTHSEESRAKMIKSRTGKKHSAETKEKISHANRGRVFSPDHCAKIRDAHLGKPAHNRGKKLSTDACERLRDAHTAEMRAIIVIAPDGTESTVYGIRQFCTKHHLDHSALTRVAKGKQGNHKGWKARYPTTNE